MMWICSPPYFLFAFNSHHSHTSGERLIRPRQMSIIKPQHVWLPHSSSAPVTGLCQTCITALCCTQQVKQVLWFSLFFFHCVICELISNIFLMNCLCFLPALGISALSQFLTVIRLLFFKLQRGVVWEPITIVKLNSLQCLARGSFVLLKNPLA